MFGAKIFLNIYLTAILPIFLADESTSWTTSLMELTSQPNQPSQPSQPGQPGQTSQPGQTTETSEPRKTRRYQLASSSLPTYIIYQVSNHVDKNEKNRVAISQNQNHCLVSRCSPTQPSQTQKRRQQLETRDTAGRLQAKTIIPVDF